MQKKGISLIVLVITIIVMIILAGAVIISLSDSGIIEKANSAVKTSNEATVKELAQTAWLEAYADGVRSVEDTVVNGNELRGFERRVKDKLIESGINIEDYFIKATTSGVTVKSIDKAWIQEDFTVKKGSQVLEIGDIVNYDETVGGTKTGLTQTDWKVLGADDKGNLLIMSTVGVSDVTLGEEGNLTKTQQDWLNAPQILNTACEPYGYGKGVVGKARSMTVEDIDKITGYDPTNIDGNGTPYVAGTIDEYGNKVTYKYNGINTPTYEGSNGVNGTLSSTYSNGFYYFNGRQFKHITNLTAGTSGTVFAKMTNDFYHYYLPDIIQNEKATQMIADNGNGYWLASNYITASEDILFGVRNITGSVIAGSPLWYSYGDNNQGARLVRAVVTLSSDIEFTGSSAEGWSY